MSEKQKPVILLVHGAWHRPLHYRSLIQALQAKGYTVLAPPLATSGYDDSVDGKTHVDDMKRIHDTLLPVLEQGKTVIGVSHSYGALPMGEALQGHTVADRASKGLTGGVASALFLAPTPVLVKGIRMLDASNGVWISEWYHDVTETRMPLKKDIAMDAMYEGVEESLRREAAAYWCEQSCLPFTTPVICTPEDLDIPKKVVVTLKDKIFPKELQVLCAQKWGAEQVEIDFGHSPWMNDSLREKLVELIDQEAGKA